jgi:hypothetical protein
MPLVLSGEQNRTSAPHLAAVGGRVSQHAALANVCVFYARVKLVVCWYWDNT